MSVVTVSDTERFLKTIGDPKTKPLIGLEYIVVFENKEKNTSLFVCVLCDKECTPNMIEPHITSHRHKMRYLVN